MKKFYLLSVILAFIGCKTSSKPTETGLLADGATAKYRLLILTQEVHAAGIGDGRAVSVGGGFLFCRIDQPTACLGNTNRWVWNERTIGGRYTSTTGDGGYIPVDPNYAVLGTAPFDGGRATLKLNLEVSAGLLWSTRKGELRADFDLADFAASTAAQPKVLQLRGSGALEGYLVEVTFVPQ